MNSEILAANVLLDMLRAQVGSYDVAISGGAAVKVRDVCDELQQAFKALLAQLTEAQEEKAVCKICGDVDCEGTHLCTCDCYPHTSICGASPLKHLRDRAEAAEAHVADLARQLEHWKKLGDGVQIEAQRLREIAAELKLPAPQDHQGFEGRHDAFSIIRALTAQLAQAKDETSKWEERAEEYFDLTNEQEQRAIAAEVALRRVSEIAHALYTVARTEPEGAFRNYILDRAKSLKAALSPLPSGPQAQELSK